MKSYGLLRFICSGLTIAVYIGLLVGALFWGVTADCFGRRLAFHITLSVASVSLMIAAAAPSYPVVGLFIGLSGFGVGGNLVLDTTVFLEYLPTDKNWIVTFMAAWWGIGQLIVGGIAWGFLR